MFHNVYFHSEFQGQFVCSKVVDKVSLVEIGIGVEGTGRRSGMATCKRISKWDWVTSEIGSVFVASIYMVLPFYVIYHSGKVWWRLLSLIRVWNFQGSCGEKAAAFSDYCASKRVMKW